MMSILFWSRPSTGLTKAYLMHAWQSRNELNEDERMGFGIIFYLTLCGHLEACFAELIGRRLSHARFTFEHLKVAGVQWSGEQTAHPAAPIHETLTGLVEKMQRDVSQQPLDKLQERFEEVFNVRLADVLEEEREDLSALRCMRNLFAHGRDITFSFKQDKSNSADLSRHPLEPAAKRLLAAGVLSSIRFDARTHHEFCRALLSDQALLYFLGRAKVIQKKLQGVPSFQPELKWPTMVELPDLTS